MSKEAELEALLEIINTSARQAIAEYKKAGNDVPTISSAEFHPLDSSPHNVALRKATRLLEGACQQLCASLASPQYTVLNVSSLSRIAVSSRSSRFARSLSSAMIQLALMSRSGKVLQISWIITLMAST